MSPSDSLGMVGVFSKSYNLNHGWRPKEGGDREDNRLRMLHVIAGKEVKVGLLACWPVALG